MQKIYRDIVKYNIYIFKNIKVKLENIIMVNKELKDNIKYFG